MSEPSKKIRVLVVDDSPMVREMIGAFIASEPDIEVVAEACDGLEAVKKVASVRPDIVTMDIEMPVLGGLEAIGRIMAEHPLPILVVTSATGVRTAFSAVAKGALDVMEKPDFSAGGELLIRKLRLLSRVDVPAHLAARGRAGAGAAGARGAGSSEGEKIVAVAASTGGPQAIHTILAALPPSFPAPIVITQHIAEGFTQGMVDWLGGGTALKVVMARAGEKLAPGTVYVNPAEHSMRVTAKGVILLGDGDPRQIYHPSCDAMLCSVALSCGARVVGLILSGMGSDGVAGMEAIRRAGGATLAQDEQSSVVFGMNRCAVERGCIEKVLPLAEIPQELLKRVGAVQ